METSTQIFTKLESGVRSYCRSFPVVFNKAKGSILYTEAGQPYIDFLAGAGVLNYGHNNEHIKQALIDYLNEDNIIHGLDFYTVIKRKFLTSFQQYILKPRGLNYKVHFCGPTGTNAVEAALKLARKVTGRSGIFAFMGGFHGMSLGSLAVTGNKYNRAAAGVSLDNVTFMPYPHGFMHSFDSIEYIRHVLDDPNSGIEKPAAMILETTQAEGGVIVAPSEWLQRLKTLCEEQDILLICDDIQTGCGRTADFFSFERAGIVPDIVLLSKAISGNGLPFSLALYKPELDIWQAAEHNGTFRGNQLAFVTGEKALTHYWSNNTFTDKIRQKERYLHDFLKNEIQPLHPAINIRGLGMIWGIDLSKLDNPELAQAVSKHCFKAGLIIERAGRNDQVIKLLPPLTIEPELLAEGCQLLKEGLMDVLQNQKPAQGIRSCC